jgi:hypothetical protein
MSENGEAKQAQQLEVDQIILTRDRKTGGVQVSGNVQDIDLTMDILNRALRFFDVQYRITVGTQIQMNIKAQQDEFLRVQRLLGKA